jgi:signal transduction histidine kinase/DNA-binding LacI/PurR family transcriptional regulator/AraC-like DNA-binding protein
MSTTRSIKADWLPPQPLRERQTQVAHRRATIGLLTANIHVGASRMLWPGAVDAAEALNLNLISFPGGALCVETAFEAQRNIVYNLVPTERLDGLVIWSSTITGSCDPHTSADFHRRYQALPRVSIVQPVEAVPTLSVDSYQGMHAAISHLLKVHGYDRVAFVRGPAAHYHAQERYRAYCDVLQEYGLPLDQRLITRPLHWEEGAEAATILLDEHGLRPGRDVQAIVAVSDLMALAVLKALQARGVQVPRDVALVGFNDSIEGQLASPPLTSVAMPMRDQGAQAVGMLARLLEGQPLPAQTMLDTHLVVRQSCGCPADTLVQAALGALPPGGLPLEQALEPIRAALQAAPPPVWGDLPLGAQELDQLLEALHAELCGASGRFIERLGQALDTAPALDTHMAVWQNGISALRRCALPHLGEPDRRRAEDLFGQARVLIGEAAQRAQAYRQLQAERQNEILREIGQALITVFDTDALADTLAEQLPRLGIRSCYLALYEQRESPAAQARLALAYTEQGRAALGPHGLHFSPAQIVPADLLPQRRHSLVVEPLFFREDQIGYIVFEIGPRDSSIYEVLRGYISSALKGALLVQEAQQARRTAEKADQIKTRLLANVSHELRTPLHLILEHTGGALAGAARYGESVPQALRLDLQHIQGSAEHQLRLINDLLDLSRADIDELDLYPELFDPRPLLEELFAGMARGAEAGVEWRLQLPNRLPWLYADIVRLRQVLLNLLSNAQKFTARGSITLGAEAAPPHLHIWVADTGTGIPADQQERVFDPFVTVELRPGGDRSGIGLGLSITRRLVALHRGTIELESTPGQGSTFHILLPLPSLSAPAATAAAQTQPTLLAICTAEQPSAAISALAQRVGLELALLRSSDDLDSLLERVQPALLAWDQGAATPGDWVIVRRLRAHPRCSQLPFVLFGQHQGEGAPAGLTSLVPKPADARTLSDAISASCPIDSIGPILIVDDDPHTREQYRAVVSQGLPGYAIRTAEDGLAAVALMEIETPSLVILDLVMPGLDGAEVLERMRADPRLRQTPVVILTNKLLSVDDIRRLDQHAHVTLHSKDILSEQETLTAFSRALFDHDALPPYTSALVKRAVAYLHQNYGRTISRWELAQEVGVSEDYLSRVFSRELGLSPWDYLNRYRIAQARALLRSGSASISAVAQQVGFQDRGYFSRVFRKLTGVGPQEFREKQEPLNT